MKKATVIEIIAYAFIILFVYTSLSKWFLYHVYLEDLQRSPLLGTYALVISFVVPASELIVAGLLYVERYRRIAFLGALILMVLFTIYVAWAIFIAKNTPCTCGGIIRELSWRHHLIFNIFFTALAAIGYWLQGKKQKTQQRNLNDISLG